MDFTVVFVFTVLCFAGVALVLNYIPRLPERKSESVKDLLADVKVLEGQVEMWKERGSRYSAMMDSYVEREALANKRYAELLEKIGTAKLKIVEAEYSGFQAGVASGKPEAPND